MKKILLVAAFCCLTMATGWAQTTGKKQNGPCSLTASNLATVSLHFSAGDLAVRNLTLLDTPFSQIGLEGYDFQNMAGRPALPSLTKLIAVAQGGAVEVEFVVLASDTLEGSALGIDHAVVPAQPSRSKSDIRPAMLVQDASVYSQDGFYGLPVVEAEAIGTARNERLARVTFNPVQWNPATNQVVVVREATATVRVREADMEATQQLQKLHSSGGFNLGAEVLNARKDNIANGPMRYTIVAYSGFRGALDEFVEWKKRQGFLVDLVYTDEVGSDTASIRNYLKGLYDNATTSSPAPTYVLLVGDVAQVPAFRLSASGESHHSDLRYCCWTAGDNIPDAYYGRFSAQNLEQLLPQISKTLMYEQYTFPNDAYLARAVLIAGEDGGYESDNAYRYCDPTMDYVAREYVKSSNGFTTVSYYKNNTNFAPTGVTVTGSSQASTTSGALRTLYNGGCGWVNYSAHGDVEEWSIPSFTTTHVAQMTNNNMPSVMIGNCCMSNSFQESACLGEALLRKADNAGAVAYVGASNYTYWAEDFYWAVGVRTSVSNTSNPSYDASHLGAYDRLFHTHGESYSDQYLTMGQMMYAGNLAVEGSNSSLKTYYWQVYHLMGDPSLLPWLGRAATMTASVPDAMHGTHMQITAVPYAYVGVTDQQHNLLYATFANASGVANISLPQRQQGRVEVMITAQGYKPFSKQVNMVIDGPYPVASALTASTTEAGQDVTLTVTISNYGNQDAESVDVELQTVAGHMLLNSTENVFLASGIDAEDVITFDMNAIAHIWENVPDQTVTSIKVKTMWQNGDTYEFASATFPLTISAPAVHAVGQNMTETFSTTGTGSLTVTNRNQGAADLGEATAHLMCLHPGITVAADVQLEGLDAGSTVSTTYSLNLAGDMPQNCIVPFIQTISDSFRTFVDTLRVPFGTPAEMITFEDSAWGDVSWTQGTYPWELTRTGAYAGNYCARSRTWSTSYWGGNTGNSSNSQLSLTWTSTVGDTLSFYKNVSSEQDYDFFRFYIDNELKEELSGESNTWRRSAYYVPAGTHVFKWSYEKDWSQRSGSDCAWIDNIHLPLNGRGTEYRLDHVCQNEEYNFNGQGITTSEVGTFQYVDSTSNPNYISYLTLVVDSAATVSINATSTSVAWGEHVRLSATGAERYEWSNGAQVPIMDVYPYATMTYSVTGYNGACSSSASVAIIVDGVLGIEPTEEEMALTLYPNPATEAIAISGNQLKTIMVCDLLGKTLMQRYVNGDSLTIDLGSWPRGVYILHATDQNGHTAVKKFIKR